jgi:hypothetical protein
MQYRCSKRCHLEQNENATDAFGGVAKQQKKKIMHVHDSPFYHYTQFPHYFAITYRGKK